MGRLFSLTYPTAAVLLAIRSGHRYGFDIMDATGLPDGTVYPILRRLERRGVLSGEWEDEAVARTEQRPARRYYALTPVGEESMGDVMARFPTRATTWSSPEVASPGRAPAMAASPKAASTMSTASDARHFATDGRACMGSGRW